MNKEDRKNLVAVTDHVQSPQKDRLITILLVVAVMTAFVVVASTFITVPKILATSSDAEQLTQNDRANACRSLYAVRLEDAKLNADQLRDAGLIAAVSDDQATVDLIVPQFATATAAVLEAQHLRSVAVELSQNHPAQFLRDCAELTKEHE